MAKRSEGFELVVIGAGVALILSFYTIWTVLLADVITKELEISVGALAAAVIEKIAAILVAVALAAASVWFLYRYVKRELRDGMTLSSPEILFRPEDERFVRWEYPPDDTHAIIRYYVGLHNAGPKSILGPSLRAHESPFVKNAIAVAHRVPAHVTTPVIWQAEALDPQATEYVELFGVDDRVPAIKPCIFHLEVRARDAKTEVAEFKYDPKHSPALRRVK
jgi:hypothetical protein